MWLDFGQWVLASVSSLSFLKEAYTGFYYATDYQLEGLFEYPGVDMHNAVGDFMTGTPKSNRDAINGSKGQRLRKSIDNINKQYQNNTLGVLSTDNLPGFLRGDVGQRQVKSGTAQLMGKSDILQFVNRFLTDLTSFESFVKSLTDGTFREKILTDIFEKSHGMHRVVGKAAGAAEEPRIFKIVEKKAEEKIKGQKLYINIT